MMDHLHLFYLLSIPKIPSAQCEARYPGVEGKILRRERVAGNQRKSLSLKADGVFGKDRGL